MLVIVELEREHIRRITIGDRPDFIGGADKLSKTKKEASSSGEVKHEQKHREVQMCHVVAWSILTKRAQRIFKGLTLEEADSWLGEPGNWPDKTGMPDSLARRNPSRASGLKAFTVVTRESVQQYIEAWLKQVNSWVENLWLGPADRNEAKGRMLHRCVSLVKQACFKSQPLYLGSHGTIACYSGDRQAEISVEGWELSEERSKELKGTLVSGEIVASDLFKQNPRASFFILRAGMAPQKLRLKASGANTTDQNSAIMLTDTFMYLKVSRAFSWTSYFGMIKGEEVIKERVFGDAPFPISDFKTLEDFLLFSAIDLKSDVEHKPGTPPSEIPLMFAEGYGHYVKRLRDNQEFNRK